MREPVDCNVISDNGPVFVCKCCPRFVLETDCKYDLGVIKREM